MNVGVGGDARGNDGSGRCGVLDGRIGSVRDGRSMGEGRIVSGREGIEGIVGIRGKFGRSGIPATWFGGGNGDGGAVGIDGAAAGATRSMYC